MPLTYDIIENNNDLEDQDEKKIVNNYKHTEIDNDIMLAMKTDYNLNYNLSYLNSIADYYEIKKNGTKKTKNDIIEKIVDFETKSYNNIIVLNRKRLFNYFNELKKDKFFNKYLIGSL
tara:strand:- start:50 stop:403 length:354 start_codon:yes stop_codon:yes gene_type:complete